jgi:hypothetical protein
MFGMMDKRAVMAALGIKDMTSIPSISSRNYAIYPNTRGGGGEVLWTEHADGLGWPQDMGARNASQQQHMSSSTALRHPAAGSGTSRRQQQQVCHVLSVKHRYRPGQNLSVC